MMLRLLLLAATAYGAAIPQNPSCLEKCLVAGGIVGAAADLNFFKSVAVDINNFCNVYTALLKCASGCSQDDLNLVMKHTMHASYICKEKLEEVKTVHDCLEADTTDPLSDCSKVCEVTEHVPLRLDSTATAPVNPNVPAEGTGPLCAKQMCVLKCGREQLNKQCAGAGDLFKEIARHQVEMGWDMLQAQSENTNDTASQMIALSYLANIPEKCVYLTNLETFDKEIGGDLMKKTEMIPGSDFSNDTSVETESSPDSSVMDGFDPTLFEFAPMLEPDVPLGPPSEDIESGTNVTGPSMVTPPEEEVKVIGGTTVATVPAEDIVTEDSVVEQSTAALTPLRESGSTLATDMDGASETVEGAGVHSQPQPADAPAAGEMDRMADGEKMSPHPETPEGSGPGLVASRPVTDEDKETGQEEEETGGDMVKEGGETMAGGVKSEEGGVAAAASGDEAAEEESAMEGDHPAEIPAGPMEGGSAATGEEKTEETEEMGDEMAGEVEKEIDGAKDSEGSEMSTQSTIVVDDENQSEIDNNEINPVTEKAKMNSAPSSLSLLSALFALIAVLFY